MGNHERIQRECAVLVISRKVGETLFIDGDRIKVHISQIRGDYVRLAFDAPPEVSIHREEVWDAIQREKAEEVSDSP